MEGFFQAGSSLDLIRVEELLFRRYSCVAGIMELDVSEGVEFINAALEKQEEDYARMQWVAMYPYMTEGTFVSFSDYFDRLLGRNVTCVPTEELLASLKKTEAKFEKGG